MGESESQRHNRNDLLTAAQIRAVEQAAIDAEHVTGLELMEQAGRGVVQAVFEEWPALGEGAHEALVLCGPGNNGGDGFVVARLLQEAGWDIDLFLFGNAEGLPRDAARNHAKWAHLGAIRDIDERPVIHEHALVVDALFGIGQNRPLPQQVQDFAAHAAVMTAMTDTRMVAVDVPSGLLTDTGSPTGEFQIFADLTVTFHRMKPCHVHAEGLSRCGKVVVRDIGL